MDYLENCSFTSGMVSQGSLLRHWAHNNHWKQKLKKTLQAKGLLQTLLPQVYAGGAGPLNMQVFEHAYRIACCSIFAWLRSCKMASGLRDSRSKTVTDGTSHHGIVEWYCANRKVHSWIWEHPSTLGCSKK